MAWVKKWMIETLRCRRHAVAGADVNAYGDVETFCLGKKGKEIGIIEVLFRCRNRRRGDGDELEFFNRAAKLLDRFRRVLNRDRGHAF